ncbi:MAG: N-acetylmuramoyl-L-alanine amidase [Spirochaetes bacterium]|nr:N-acetylmuramoyl-L-alanine amidase [Spirochaetota bacterium]
MSVHGDRYDTVSGRYLDYYKEGAARGRLHERVIVYNIAKKTEKLLKLLAPGGNRKRFFNILEKYSEDNPPQITVLPYMSRGRSITDSEAEGKKDPNAPFRMFDYPDCEGNMQQGRMSRINELRPHLVVSLHLARAGPSDFEGMSPVITPSYGFLRQGLEYLRGKRRGKRFFLRSPYREWFIEETSRSDFEWYLNDVSLYFTGYPLTRRREPDSGGFKGYRYNMVRWAYSDKTGWERAARHHIASSRYADSFEKYVPEGKFWDRERSSYERSRRDGGREGFGGDNAYASYEIIRYIYYSLYLRGDEHRSQKPGKSYISVWIMPLHVNAINAFIELGYLNRSRDRFLLTKRQDAIAEGIAVGIYSLLSGLTPKDRQFNHAPMGKGIDFTKYRTPEGRSYFDEVTCQ